MRQAPRLLSVFVLFVLLLFGCGKQPTPEANEQTGETSETETTPSDQPDSSAANASGEESSTGQTAGTNSKAPAKETALNLMPGKDLAGWRVVETIDFERHGKVFQNDEGHLVLEPGKPGTGVSTTVSGLPTTNYEVLIEARRTKESDFFFGLTFPVGNDPCSLILGGWGGGTIGLSNVDGYDASENETGTYEEFENGKWYEVRLAVTDNDVKAWLDGEEIISIARGQHEFSIRWEQEAVLPETWKDYYEKKDKEREGFLGYASWVTGAEVRKIQLKKLPAPEKPGADDKP